MRSKKAADAYLNDEKELENNVPWDKLTTHSRKRASKYKGVYSSGDKWVARLWVNQKFIYLGRFNTEYETYQTGQKALNEYKNSKDMN